MTRRRLAKIAFVLAFAAPGFARADTTDQCIASAENGQRLRRDARLRAARDELIACAREACPAAIARDCKRWLAEVEGSLPSIVVRVVDSGGRDVTDAVVTVDGEVATVSAAGRPLELDPGEHTVRAERNDLTTSASIVVGAGEHDRLISLEMPDAARRAQAPRASISPATWALGGAGLVAAGAGVLFWLEGRSDRSSLFATCGVSRTCTNDDRDRAQTKLVVGDLLFAGGVVALGAAVFVGIASSRAPAPSVRVGASPTAGGGVVVGSGAF